MKLSIILFGALTSKPYAFKARSWELKSIETIDLFDSLCSNIRLDVRGSEIMRILPVNNESINEEWISDKARYAFDGFKRERFINPMIKKNNIFVQATWEEALDFTSRQVVERRDKGIKSNLVINTGNFTDIQHIVSLHTFVMKLAQLYGPIINAEKNINSDLQEYYTIRENIFKFKGQKIILLVGINLRLENPILNIKLKRLSLNNNVLIGYIGSKNNYNINCEHLGNNISVLTDIISGKHPFCVIAANFLKKNLKNLKIANIFKNPISVLFGNEIRQTNNHIKLIKSLKNVKTPFLNFEYNVLELYSGRINMLDLGFFRVKRKLRKKKHTIFYLLNNENIKNYKEGDFVIFQGDHNISKRAYFDVILPSVNWTEKSSLYLNCFGFVQKSQFAIWPPINAREDWKITYMLVRRFIQCDFEACVILGEGMSLTNQEHLWWVIKRIHAFSPNLLNLINQYKFKTKQKLNITDNKIQIIIKKSKMPFKSFIFNYYQISSIEKSSKIMTNCSKSFMENKLNFIK